MCPYIFMLAPPHLLLGYRIGLVDYETVDIIIQKIEKSHRPQHGVGHSPLDGRRTAKRSF
jgi:hypothetical protein